MPHNSCDACTHSVFYGASSEYANYGCRRNMTREPNLVGGGYRLVGKEVNCNTERTESGQCGIEGKFFEPKQKPSSKPYITIAIEPCGEFCNKGEKRCPFSEIWTKGKGDRKRKVSVSCKIFGDIGPYPIIGNIPRHEGCLEAQKLFEQTERSRR